MGVPSASLSQNGTSDESPVSHLVACTAVYWEESEYLGHQGQAHSINPSVSTLLYSSQLQ